MTQRLAGTHCVTVISLLGKVTRSICFFTLCDIRYCRGFFWTIGGKIMRIWDISPKKLCRNHLLGEHRELHAIWSILTKNKKGYSKHPETLRWKNKLAALYARHQEFVKEMKNRGYNHYSNLDIKLATGSKNQDILLDSYKRQTKILKNKNCDCQI